MRDPAEYFHHSSCDQAGDEEELVDSCDQAGNEKELVDGSPSLDKEPHGARTSSRGL